MADDEDNFILGCERRVADMPRRPWVGGEPPGEHPAPLTEEDEASLDRAWKELADGCNRPV